jgi:glucosylceramidase
MTTSASTPSLYSRPTIASKPLTILVLICAVLLLVACPGDRIPPPVKQTGPDVHVVMTTGDQAKLLAPQSTVSFQHGGSQNPLVITVDAKTRYQQMDGAGGSLTDSSAWLIWNKLDAGQQSALMQELFSPSDGIGISFLREPMGASDFAVNGNYSYDDVPAGQTDPTLANFSISHDTTYIVPLLAQARTINPAVKIVALPWSPPAWMKTNGSMNGGSMIIANFPSLAQYFVKFLQAYQQRGIPIYAISVQNEPQNSVDTYPSELLSATDESDFIANHLGPALNTAGLTQTKVFGYEHNWDNTNYPETILGSGAGTFVAGTAFHCYAGDVSAQSTVQADYPAKDLWFTECSGTVGSNFGGDLVWNSQHLLIGATRNWARSVSLWNLALDQNSGPKNGGCPNCRGVVTIDTSTAPATITRNVEYYVLGHLGKFVVPGAVRISSNTFGAGSIEDVAFQNPDGSIVLFVLNSSSSTQTFTVNWQSKTFSYSLPTQSVATFEWK